MDPEEFEAIVRRVVREELHRHRATGDRPQQTDPGLAIRGWVREEMRRGGATPYVPTPQTLGAAVRAEAARAGVRHHELAEASGISPPTLWGRLKGAYEFKRAELDKIAERLGITTENILQSAQLAQHFKADGQQLALRQPDVDDWALPSRSVAARRRQAPRQTG